MKRIYLSAITSICVALSAYAQDISGPWNGVLKVSSTQLRLVFNITNTAEGFNATLDSPDQGAKGIPVTSTIFKNEELTFTIPAAGIEYVGVLKEGKFVGVFKQGGQSFPLDLSKGAVLTQSLKRPQEPQKPYPYYSEEIVFENQQANISLAGTLTLPKSEGTFPAVILISGSGPQNRDEELLGHKPFLVISDYLTRNGIAVMRFDDRGVGQSKGVFSTATSADHATDVEAALAYLKTRKEIKQIGLVGHSEGGLIAPMVAATNKDIAFVVMLAGTGIRGDKLLLKQTELIARAGGATEKELEKTAQINAKVFEMIVKSEDDAQLKKDLTAHFTQLLKENADIEKPKEMTNEDYVAAQVKETMKPFPWMKFFLKYDPTSNLVLVKCPVLALNGEKDLQVPAQDNLVAIENTLKKSGNKDVTTKMYPGLNHLFQETTTGNPAEYQTIEQTFSPLVMEDFTKWIRLKTGL